MTPITHEYTAEIMSSERLVDGATWRRIVEFLIDAYAADVGNARRECDKLRADYAAATAVTGNMMREYAEMRDKTNDLSLKISAMVKWLENNQQDVFARGIWDAIIKSHEPQKHR